MTQLETLAYLGEIVGAIAVVVSLIYVAIQVRQNTQAQRTENFSRALDRVAAMQANLSQDSEAAAIMAKGVEDPATLAPRERIQFTWGMYELFGAFEFMYLAAKTDAIPDEVWQRWSSAVSWWLAFPGIRTWWQIRPIPFTDSFSAYIESLLASDTINEEMTKRYRDFVAHGTGPG